MFDGGNGQLLRVENATGEPAAISAHVAPDHLYGAEAGTQRCANWQFIPVEGDGYDAGFHWSGRMGPGVPLSAQPRPRVAVAKFDRHIRDFRYERSEASAGSGALLGFPVR